MKEALHGLELQVLCSCSAEYCTNLVLINFFIQYVEKPEITTVGVGKFIKIIVLYKVALAQL